MAHSSLLGIDPVPTTPAGRDSEALGPSDSSDSGSDVAGLADRDEGDPGLPVDVATGEDSAHPETSFEALAEGSDTDATGTGERRSAGGDAGLREGADISPDRVVFDPNTGAPADGVLDDVLDGSPQPEGGVDAPLYASDAEASTDAAHVEAEDEGEDEELGAAAEDTRRRAAAAGGEHDENEEVEPPPPGGSHPRAHSHHPARRERDHGLSGPEPDAPAQTPPPVNDPGDEGVNDEGDDTVVVPKK
jgi:hypothetical protein